MTRIEPIEGFLMNLRQEIPPERIRLYMTREEAYEALKKMSGKDFGIDNVVGWEQWAKEYGNGEIADE